MVSDVLCDDSSKSGLESSSKSNRRALIPWFPDDIAVSCLVRVPRRYHPLLSCVSKKWRELVCSNEFLSYRLKHSLEEAWIYALCRDKSQQLCIYVLDPSNLKRGWERINGLPNCLLNRKGLGFEVLGTKIYLFGGCAWDQDSTSEVYCYDALTNTWSTAGSLSVPRCYFTHEALNGKIIVIGGFGSNLSYPLSWDSYDPQTNCWSSHADPNIFPDVEDSFILDGKIYIRCGASAMPSHVNAVVYEPSSGTLQDADADLASGWRGPAVVIDGVLYVLDQTLGVRLMVWQKDYRVWMTLRRLSTPFTRPPCRLVAVGKKIFIIGKELSTLVFEVQNIVNVDGVLVSSSVRKLVSDHDVIGCKSLAI